MGVLQDIGYSLHLPGFGISEPAGTPWSSFRSPAAVAQQIPSDTTTNNGVTYWSSPVPTNGQPKNDTFTPPAPPPNGGGSYAPAPSAPQSRNNNPGSINGDQQQQRENAIRGRIGSGFDDYLKSLDTQLGLLPEHYNALKGTIDSLYGGQKGTIDTFTASNNADLDRSTQQVDTNKANSIRTLGQDLNDALTAGNARLGTMGASDSSAAPMYSYALGLQANKNRGMVETQANGLYNDIGLKRAQVGVTANDELSKLDTWKNGQISDLDKWLVDQKSAIAEKQGQTQKDKSLALASLDQSALTRLQQLDDQHTQFENSVKTWALNHQTALDTTLAYATRGAGMTVNPFVTNLLDTTVQGATGGPNNAANIYGGNPFTPKKTDQYGNPIA